MKNKELAAIGEGIKKAFPGADVSETENGLHAEAELEAGIKGIHMEVLCSASSVRIKGQREYPYPIMDNKAEAFCGDAMSRHPGYTVYVSGQSLNVSKMYTYQGTEETLAAAAEAGEAMRSIAAGFEKSCVNFLEDPAEGEGGSHDADYDPEKNVEIINVDNTAHAVSVTEQDDIEYEKKQQEYAKAAFMEFCEKNGADPDGGSFSSEDGDGHPVNCILFEQDAQVLVCVSVPCQRDDGTLYDAYMAEHYADVMVCSYSEEEGAFEARMYVSPNPYEPDALEDAVRICKAAVKACITECAQTVDKKNSAGYAADVSRILDAQAGTLAEKEAALAEREAKLKEAMDELNRKENELEKKNEGLEEKYAKKAKALEESEAEAIRLKKEAEEAKAAAEEQHTKDILMIQQLTNQIKAYQDRQKVYGHGSGASKDDMFRLESKVRQSARQMQAMEKKLTEKIAAKDSQIRKMSDTIAEKENEIAEKEAAKDEAAKILAAEAVEKAEGEADSLRQKLDKIGHILTPEDMTGYLKQFDGLDPSVCHAKDAIIVAYTDGPLEIRVRFGNIGCVDVIRKAAVKDQVLRRLNAEFPMAKFFDWNEHKIAGRQYFKQNATPEEVEAIIESVSSRFKK